MSAFIPYGRHFIDEEDIKSVVEVLRSDWITQGPMIERFEKALADYCGARYAVVVSSGTAALHLACLAAGVGPGDEVITSPITFVASANCAVYCGGKPVFVDIEPQTINLDTAKLESYLINRDKDAGTKPKVIIPVHFGGLPCDMEKIGGLAREYNLTVIEDACHALGAEYKTAAGEWVKVGSCRHSDMAVFSFHPVKHIATGEGGAILTNNGELDEKLKMLRTHGITKDPKKFSDHKMAFTRMSGGSSPRVNGWYYEVQELGFNYRITDLQCALGLSQLKKLDDWLARRREVAEQYNTAFADLDSISFVQEPTDRKSACHLYVVQVHDRDATFRQLQADGIGAQVHYIPVHFQPIYRRTFNYGPGDFPEAERYYYRCLSLPLFPTMPPTDVSFVADRVRSIVEKVERGALT